MSNNDQEGEVNTIDIVKQNVHILPFPAFSRACGSLSAFATTPSISPLVSPPQDGGGSLALALNYGDGPETRTMTEIQRRRLPQVTTSKLQTFELGIPVTHSGKKVIRPRSRRRYTRFQGIRAKREPHPR